MSDLISKVSGLTGVQVPISAITAGPRVQWNHIDGPLMSWGWEFDWLTWRERFAVWIGRRTVDEVACARWPQLAERRALLRAMAAREGR